jgi:N-methylhydantoinase B/oxoprolinase/acetone carboxylase alpha subunit
MPGASGCASLIDGKETAQILPSKCSVQVHKGDRIRIETPGGGGWGNMKKEPADLSTTLRSGRDDNSV